MPIDRLFLLPLRRLARSPLEILGIVATLAVGIGLLGAIVSLLQGLLSQPMTSFSEAEEMVTVYHHRRPEAPEAGPPFQFLALEDFRSLKHDNGSFSAVAAGQAVRSLFRYESLVETLDGEMVSAGFFDLAGVDPFAGRFFYPQEDAGPGSGPVVVLAHAFWQSRFAAEPDLVGKSVSLNNSSFTVVGIAPPGFLGSNRLNPADFWVPLSMYRQVFVAPDVVERRDGRFLAVWARLKSNVGPEAAAGELEATAARWSEEWPETHGIWGLSLRPLSGGPPTPYQAGLQKGQTLLMSAALSLLALGCLNIGNLLLIRLRKRRRDLAIRLALGAGRRRLVVMETLDILLWVSVGGLLAGVVAHWARQLLWSFRPGYLDERILQLQEGDPRLFAATLAVAIAVGFIFVAIPLVSLGRRKGLAEMTKTVGSSTSKAPRGKRWTMNGQIVLQVALSTLLLGLAFLFMDGLRESRQTDLGFRTEGMVLASFDLQLDGFSPERQRDFRERAVERLRGLPTVSAVGVAENRVLGGFRLWREVSSQEGKSVTVGSSLAAPGYFDSVRLRRLTGRDFAPGDGDHKAILNKALASQLFDTAEQATQKSIVVDGKTLEVAGVVADSAVMAPGEEPMPFLYLPLERELPSSRFTLHLTVAEGGDERAVAADVRAVFAELAPGVPIERLDTIADVLDEALWLERLSVGLLGAFAIVGLLMAGLGIYTVAAADAQQRYREVGIRMAIGASRAEIGLSALWRGFAAMSAGAALGLVLVVWCEGVAQGLLYDAGSLGFATLASTLATFVVLGGIAQLLPAWRAATTDPVNALRDS